jgi:hypothetical protein
MLKVVAIAPQPMDHFAVYELEGHLLYRTGIITCERTSLAQIIFQLSQFLLYAVRRVPICIAHDVGCRDDAAITQLQEMENDFLSFFKGAHAVVQPGKEMGMHIRP